NFGVFLKEGVATDGDNRNELAKLLLYDSSADPEKKVSLEQYLERMPEKQPAIYYITGPNREAIEAGPYGEALISRGYEILYCYEGVDDFVMSALREFEGKPIISADQKDLKLEDTGGESPENAEEALSEKEAGDLARWIKEQLGDTVQEVQVSKRLVKSAAILVNPDEMFTTGMQRMMQTVTKGTLPSKSMVLEINPAHPILKRLAELRTQPDKAELVSEAAKMLLDNAMIAAGLLVDPKTLVERSSRILEAALA
ncbi:MAG: molecular chaperone HtpG, partial [bacterium]